MARASNIRAKSTIRAKSGGASWRDRMTAPVRSVSLASAVALFAFAHGVETVSLHPVSPAAAQSEGVTTRQEVFEAYTEAQELLEAGDTNGAARVIQNVLNSDENTPTEIGILSRFLANIELERERYPQAIAALERAIGTNTFEGPELAELYFFIGGLYLSVERFDDAIRSLERFFTLAESPNDAAYYLLAQAYAVSERWSDALTPARRAVELAPEPREQYLVLLTVIYINLNQWENAVPLLERMVQLFPGKDTYWQQLGAGYQELRREQDAYSVQELRYKQGFLTRSRDIVILADLHAYYGYPFKAAKLLSEEMERGRVDRDATNLEKLGLAWLAAREYTEARQALIAASNLSGSGRLDFRLGQTYAQDEEWQQADRYLSRAINRGGLNASERASAWLLLGHARNNLNRRQAAIDAFTQAARFESTRRNAETWLDFLRTQQELEAQREIVDAVDTIMNLVSRNQQAMTEVEILRDVALQALETAQRARDAETDRQQARALEEYEIRIREAEAILERQAPLAETDMEQSGEAISVARNMDLDAAAQRDLERLEEVMARRQTLIEQARENVATAREIVEALLRGEKIYPEAVEEAADGDGGETGADDAGTGAESEGADDGADSPSDEGAADTESEDAPAGDNGQDDEANETP